MPLFPSLLFSLKSETRNYGPINDGKTRLRATTSRPRHHHYHYHHYHHTTITTMNLLPTPRLTPLKRSYSPDRNIEDVTSPVHYSRKRVAHPHHYTNHEPRSTIGSEEAAEILLTQGRRRKEWSDDLEVSYAPLAVVLVCTG